MIKKLLLFFLVFLLLFTTVSVPFASAQTTSPWYMPGFNQWYTKVYDTTASPPSEIFGERYTAAQVSWVIYSLIAFLYNLNDDGSRASCIINGGDVIPCIQKNGLFTYNPNVPSNLAQGQKVGILATLFPTNRSISGVNYVREKLANLHIVPEAQAQGFGFGALNPVQRIWRAFRDIMYGFFVLIIIAFAFMIMFRMKISPQTVVTVQSALPKIVFALILVTFSYAIAGFMIDIMYLLIGLIALVFQGLNIYQFTSGTNGWQAIFNLITIGPGDAPWGILGWFYVYWIPFMMALIGAAWSGNGFATIISGPLGSLFGILITIGVIIWLIITIAKVFIMLIKAYLGVLLSVIFAPLIIGFGTVLPGGGFGSWLKGLISNLLVYPVTGVLILISFMFLGSTYNEVQLAITGVFGTGFQAIFSPFDQQATFWYPPLTFGSQSGTWDPLPILWIFSSLAIFAMIPKVVDIIKGLMSGKGVEAGSAIGAAMGAIGGYAVGAARLPIERPIMTAEANREAAARVAGVGYVPRARTEILRRTGLYKR